MRDQTHKELGGQFESDDIITPSKDFSISDSSCVAGSTLLDLERKESAIASESV